MNRTLSCFTSATSYILFNKLVILLSIYHFTDRDGQIDYYKLRFNDMNSDFSANSLEHSRTIKLSSLFCHCLLFCSALSCVSFTISFPPNCSDMSMYEAAWVGWFLQKKLALMKSPGYQICHFWHISSQF